MQKNWIRKKEKKKQQQQFDEQIGHLNYNNKTHYEIEIVDVILYILGV